jgi:hypothetical protein
MPALTRRSLLGAAASVIAVGSASSQVKPAAPIAYTTYAKQSVQLRPFVGRQVALLVDPARSIDRVVNDRVLSALDRAWDWYRSYFGRTPSFYNPYAGKLTVAEVAAGDSALTGYGGMELHTDTMTQLLTEAKTDRYNQAAFYFFGHNFWFFDNSLGRIAAFTEGFCHVHRFHCMEALALTGAPWDDNVDFDHYRHSIIIDMLTRYLADRTLTWENTLAANKAPANPHGWVAGDLAAAFFHRIRRDHGHAGYRRFWQVMADAPKSEKPRDSAARFVQIARAATGEDYRWLMRDPSLPLVY